jgi:UDP-N-acetylglucosamine:LPS N-acetylglucosamine transferase
MSRKRVLFVSGSLGLGHITRDLAIADELRKMDSNVEIAWLAAHPASLAITQAGERLLPQSDQYSNENIVAERLAGNGRLDLMKFLTKASREWKKNFQVFKQVIESEGKFDLIVGDETYDLAVGFQKNPDMKRAPFVMIYDFIGIDAMTRNPLDRLGTYIWNRIWAKDYMDGRAPVFDLGLFVGNEEDVPDKSFGLLLPNRRKWAKDTLEFLGYVFPFDPGDYADPAAIRARLKYGKETLIVCAIGGTSIGGELLDLCRRAHPLIRNAHPELRMVLVCGPRLSATSIGGACDGIEVKEYVPALYEHFAACDLAIVQGGGTSTLELTALQKPFIFFPLQGHFEQAQVARRLARLNAGVEMSYSHTSPEQLARSAISLLEKKTACAPIATDGAVKAARLMHQRFLI